MAFCQLWLQSLKTSAAAVEGVPLAWPWYLPRPHRLFLLGFEAAMWHVLGRPQNPQRPHKLFLLGFETAMWHVLGKPQKLFLLGFETAMWHVLGRRQTLKTSAAAFEGLRTSQPSAAAQ